MEDKKSVFVTIDNTIEDVLKYDSEGKEVFFKDDLYAFIKLSSEDYEKLPKKLKTRYNTSKKTHAIREEEAEEDALIQEIELGTRAPNAIGQLEILNKDPNLDYYLAAKNKVAQKRLKGFRIDKSGATCFGVTPTNGVTFVGYSDELVLMSRPKELAKKRRQKRNEQVADQFGKWLESTEMDYKE